MGELPTDLPGMLGVVVGELDNMNRRADSRSAAEIDQDTARARDLAREVGLDLTDPYVAEILVRVCFAVMRTSRALIDSNFERTWTATARAGLHTRIAEHARAVALGQLTAAAAGTLTVPHDVLPQIGGAGG